MAMQSKQGKPPRAALHTVRTPRSNKPRGTAASNAALNQQNRRVLAQHYRAKYGVK